MSDNLKYYIGRITPQIETITGANVMWNMYGVCVFSIPTEWTRDLCKLQKSYEEIGKDLGQYGTQFFGEVRAVTKVSSDDEVLDDIDDLYKVSSEGPKAKIVLPEEKISAVIEFMKLAAKLIIEDEFDRKFLTLKSRNSKLEQFLWDAQVRESNNLEGETPVLDSIAAAKGEKVADVAASVLANQTAFKDKVILLNAEMLKVKTEFKNCATIKELNLLWQKYMGIPMPNDQMLELGQVHEEEGALTTDTVEAGLHL